MKYDKLPLELQRRIDVGQNEMNALNHGEQRTETKRVPMMTKNPMRKLVNPETQEPLNYEWMVFKLSEQPNEKSIYVFSHLE